MEVGTTAVDTFVVLFNSLTGEEQEEAFQRISELRLRRLAGDENSMARFIRSMRTVAEYVGHAPSVDEDKPASSNSRSLALSPDRRHPRLP